VRNLRLSGDLSQMWQIKNQIKFSMHWYSRGVACVLHLFARQAVSLTLCHRVRVLLYSLQWYVDGTTSSLCPISYSVCYTAGWLGLAKAQSAHKSLLCIMLAILKCSSSSRSILECGLHRKNNTTHTPARRLVFLGTGGGVVVLSMSALAGLGLMALSCSATCDKFGC
jgi:hypothetical protein